VFTKFILKYCVKSNSYSFKGFSYNCQWKVSNYL